MTIRILSGARALGFLAPGFLALGLLAAAPASAEPRAYALPEEAAQLRAAKGHDTEAGFAAAQGNCMSCHSPDYIAMQPPGKGKAFWDAEVTKMMKVYGAPIGEADGKAIVEYLAQTY